MSSSQIPLTFLSAQRKCSFSLHSFWLYSHADRDAFCDYIIDVPREDIFNSGDSAADTEFCELIGMKFLYTSSLLFWGWRTGENIRSLRKIPPKLPWVRLNHVSKHLVVINIFYHTRIHRFLKGKEILKDRYSHNHRKEAMLKIFFR